MIASCLCLQPPQEARLPILPLIIASALTAVRQKLLSLPNNFAKGGLRQQLGTIVPFARLVGLSFVGLSAAFSSPALPSLRPAHGVLNRSLFCYLHVR